MSFAVIPEEKRASLRNIIGTALEDQSFKERLMENPGDAVRELYPDFIGDKNKSITVVDQSDEIMTQYVNISRANYALLGGNIEDLAIELSEEELEMVAGGISCIWDSCNGGDGGGTDVGVGNIEV